MFCTLIFSCLSRLFVSWDSQLRLPDPNDWYSLRPRLGSTLAKVVAVGFLYFVMAFIDGIVRSTKVGLVSVD